MRPLISQSSERLDIDALSLAVVQSWIYLLYITTTGFMIIRENNSVMFYQLRSPRMRFKTLSPVSLPPTSEAALDAFGSSDDNFFANYFMRVSNAVSFATFFRTLVADLVFPWFYSRISSPFMRSMKSLTTSETLLKS
jgi:hypothetical protein